MSQYNSLNVQSLSKFKNGHTFTRSNTKVNDIQDSKGPDVTVKWSFQRGLETTICGSTPLYSQLTLSIYAAMNGLGGVPKLTCPRARETLGTPLHRTASSRSFVQGCARFSCIWLSERAWAWTSVPNCVICCWEVSEGCPSFLFHFKTSFNALGEI